MPGTSSVQDSAHGSLAGGAGWSSPYSSGDGACGGHASQSDDGLRRSCHGSSADQGSTGASADERGSRSSAGQSRSSGFEDGGRSHGPLTRAPRRIFGSPGNDNERVKSGQNGTMWRMAASGVRVKYGPEIHANRAVVKWRVNNRSELHRSGAQVNPCVKFDDPPRGQSDAAHMKIPIVITPVTRPMKATVPSGPSPPTVG